MVASISGLCLPARRGPRYLQDARPRAARSQSTARPSRSLQEQMRPRAARGPGPDSSQVVSPHVPSTPCPATRLYKTQYFTAVMVRISTSTLLFCPLPFPSFRLIFPSPEVDPASPSNGPAYLSLWSQTLAHYSSSGSGQSSAAPPNSH